MNPGLCLPIQCSFCHTGEEEHHLHTPSLPYACPKKTKNKGDPTLFFNGGPGPLPASLPSRNLEKEIVLPETGDGGKSCLPGKSQDRNAVHFVGRSRQWSPLPHLCPLGSPFPRPGLPPPAASGPRCTSPSLDYHSTWQMAGSLNLVEQKNECLRLHKYSFHKYQTSTLCLPLVGAGTQRQIRQCPGLTDP